MTGPILTFRQLVEDRDNLDIFDTQYELKQSQEFNIIELARLTVDIERIGQLPTEEALPLIDRVVLQILPDLKDTEDFANLDPEEKKDFIKVFSESEHRRQAEKLKGQSKGRNALDEEEFEDEVEPADWGMTIPKLQKFYGGSPQDWLKLPMRWLDAYAESLPVLKAEYMLELGQGFFTGQWPTSDDHKDAIEKAIQTLKSLLDQGKPVVCTQEEAESRLAFIGFAVRHHGNNQ